MPDRFINWAGDYMSQDHSHASGTGETTPRLLSSNRVDGVTVYSREGDKLGSVAAFIFDRFTENVAIGPVPGSSAYAKL